MAFEIVDVEFEQKPREYKGGPKGPRPRTEEQKPWDDAFKKAMDSDGILALQVSPDDAEFAKKRVISAARFFDRAVTEGQPKPGRREGTVILTWKIRVPTKRGPRNRVEAAQKSAE